MSDATDKLLAEQTQAVARLEEKLGVPKGLFNKLKDEDDWSFIIKMQALLETALTYLIKSTLGRDELEDFIEKLNLQGRTGKLAVVKALSLLTNNHLKYLGQLAELRNKVAHKIQYVTFTLSEHLKGMNEKAFKDFVLTALVLPTDVKFELSKELQEMARENPRLLLWMGALDCLTSVYLHNQRAEEQKMLAAIYEGFYVRSKLKDQGLGGLFQNRLSDLCSGKGLLSNVPDEAAPAQGPEK
ncbi:MAG: hypothetical protein LC110_05320 [Burkholderiales bacterium]|nr:hypothetical protein [Burkholderiales bacterium]